MNKKSIIILFVFLLSFSYIQGQTKKEKKKALREEGYQKAKELVNSKKIDFEADWALAQRGTRINLIGNSNYLRIKGDSVFTYLPYFGVRTGGAYGDGGGIKIQNVLKNLKIDFDDDKQRVRLKFNASDSFENIDFVMTIFSNGNTSITAYSNTRSSISYDGEAVELVEKEE